MPTATAKKETPLKQPTGKRMYAAYRSELRIVWKPIEDIYAGTPPRKVGAKPGKTLEFHGGILTTSDPETIEFLEGHQRKGDMLNGFWPVPEQAPDASAEEILAIFDAAKRESVEDLQALIDAEQTGFNRKAIVDVAQAALDAIHKQGG